MHLLNPKGLLKLSFGPNWVQKTKTSIIYEISRMLSSNMHFSLAHFTDFNFAHLEIEESFWVNLGKITKGSISPANFCFGYLKGACFTYGLYFLLVFCIIEVLGKFG